MKLFGKKKKDEEEDEEFEEEHPKRRRRPKDKEFKDLNPENSKRRKTPPKPWGKRERMTVFITLLLTVLLSTLFYISSRNWSLPYISNFSNPFSVMNAGEISELQGTIEEQKNARMIISEFNKATKNLSGVYGFYILRLDNGTGYGVRQNETFQAASLLKLPVMAAMYQEAEGNRLNLDAKYFLKEQDKLKGAGSLYGKPAGYEVSYRSVVRLMGKQSDNTAYNIAKKFLGEEKIDEAITQAGMQNTTFGDNTTTPADVSNFYQKLWNGELIKDHYKDELLEFLTDTVFEDWIASGVDGVRVAHKFGREVNVVNDAGIVFSERPYVLVVMGKGIVEREANKFYPEFSAFVFEEEGMKLQ